MNKEDIIKLLATNDKAVARALVVLTERQTADEQNQETTKYLNGQGFRPCNARVGTSMANFYLRNGYLTPKQVAYWRKPIKGGTMRIAVYAGQLLQIANDKAKAELKKVASLDVGNLAEEVLVLEEMLKTTKDDSEFIKICDRILQINEQIEEIRRCEFKMSR